MCDRTYDGLDRLVGEATPEGSVEYTYDAAGRRTAMLVNQQHQVSYTYDDDNRVTQIAQGSSTVAFGYDNDGRRTSLTLPNGVTMTYGYDGASQLTGINYALGGTTLGNLTYAYDLAGRRTTVGGSFARSNVPAALASASYNANNQMTQFGAAALAYDLNGNLTSDGTNTYTWNARNQLASISGGVAASFQYDAFGRRASKTVGGTTGYLYDGLNPVQELSGGTESANLLIGLGVDEYFQRTDASGSANFLTDALGSTLALTDSGGNTLASYTYDPFGNTSISGSSANPFQYTGRETDGTGLEFYRSRYYSPTLQRFLSEDHAGFLGGDSNLYAYAQNSPTNETDANGTNPACAIGALLAFNGYLGYQIYNELSGRKSTFGAGWSGALHGLTGGIPWAMAGCMAGMGGSAIAGALGGGLAVSAEAAGADAIAEAAAGGAEAATDAGDVTPVIGRLPATSAYANLPGFEIVDPAGWSPEINTAWIQANVDAGKSFLLASPITEGNILSVTNANGFTVFADEISQILGAGYEWVGDYLIPPH